MGSSVKDASSGSRRVPRAVKFVGMALLVLALVLGGFMLFARNTAEAAKATVVVMENPSFEGTWEVDVVSKDGKASMENELEVVRALHMSRYLTLESDGKAVLELLGSRLKGTWEMGSGVSARLEMGLSKLEDLGLADVWDLRLDGQDLVVSGNGWQVRMFRIDASDKQNENLDVSDVNGLVERYMSSS